MDILAAFCAEVQEKEELRGIDTTVIQKIVTQYCTRKRIDLEKLTKRDLKIVRKEIRAELRLMTGRFRKQTEYSVGKDYAQIVREHRSTRERLAHASAIKEAIYASHPHSIADIGCGIARFLFAEPGVTYYAADINRDDLTLVEQYFAEKNIKGTVFVHNLRDSPETLPAADVVLPFKVLDVVGPQSYTHTKKLLNGLNTKHILVSFSTTTLSGKPMKYPRRRWFERVLNELQFPYTIKHYGSEVVYPILTHYTTGPSKTLTPVATK